MTYSTIIRWSVRTVSILVVVIGMAACEDGAGDTPNNTTVSSYESARQDALMNIGVIRDFHKLYPDASEGIARYGDSSVATYWKAETALYSRYRLVLQVPLELSSDRRKVVSAGDPSFYLVEVAHVEDRDDKLLSMHAGKTWEFSFATWEELKQAQGRIEDVFEGIRTDDPVDRFDAYVEYMKYSDGRIEDATQSMD